MASKDYIGLRLEQFELLEEIGHGGSARVYRARDHLASRDVAIKIIPNDVEDRQDFIARFDREIEIVRALAHEHIVEVFGFGETEEVVFLVMRLLDGGSLRTKLDATGQLPVGLAALYGAQMARALHYAHQHGIIHRDVKPSNMLFAKENPYHLLLADFGIAKIQGLRGMTKSGIAIGTPEYMSPEQAEGKESDPRSDIYSLGIVLYEMLAGRPPFKGPSPVAIMYQHVHVSPAYIRGYNTQAPVELCQIVETALRKHPDERFPTAEHLQRALEPFLGFGEQMGMTRSAGPHASGPRSTMTPRLYPNAVLPYPPYFDGHAPVSAPLTPEEREQISQIGTLPPAVGSGAEPGQTAPPGETASPSYPLRSLRQTYGPAPGGRRPGGVETRRLSEDDLAMEAVEQVTSPPELRTVRNIASASADISEQETLTRGAPAVSTGSPRARQRVKSEPLNLPVRTDGPRGTAQSGKLLAGMTTASAGPAVASPPDRPASRASGNDGGEKKRPRRRGWVLALTVIVTLGLLSAVAVSTGATRFLPHTGAVATPSATTAPTATIQPTATATAAPSGTATLTLQQQLDRQAANSFRAVTLAKSQDGSCGSNTTAFSVGQTVYVNMCTSSRVAPGPVSVTIRQVGSLCALSESGGALKPTASYFCYSTFSLDAGSYDMAVSIKINGTPATARVIHFTVG
ncbi:MAG TPA: protein kinase [Ktedonobacterales bacterium]|jgi:serine/threonine-protein kinase|nr:protein kinase [Ktedonobacterales bacterium]